MTTAVLVEEAEIERSRCAIREKLCKHGLGPAEAEEVMSEATPRLAEEVFAWTERATKLMKRSVRDKFKRVRPARIMRITLRWLRLLSTSIANVDALYSKCLRRLNQLKLDISARNVTEMRRFARGIIVALKIKERKMVPA